MLVTKILTAQYKSEVYHIMFNIAVGLTLISACLLYRFEEKVIRRERASEKQIEVPLLK